MGGLYSKAYVAGVAREIAEARALIAGRYDGAKRLDRSGLAQNVRMGERGLWKIQRTIVGQAVAGGRGEGKARSGLVRALHGHAGREGTARGALQDLVGGIWAMRDLPRE